MLERTKLGSLRQELLCWHFAALAPIDIFVRLRGRMWRGLSVSSHVVCSANDSYRTISTFQGSDAELPCVSYRIASCPISALSSIFELFVLGYGSGSSVDARPHRTCSASYRRCTVISEGQHTLDISACARTLKLGWNRSSLVDHALSLSVKFLVCFAFFSF